MSTFSEFINADEPVLVDFFAEWCGPCKALAPVLSQLAGELEGKLRFLKVDIDKNPQAAAYYSIRGIPTLMLFRKGEIKWRQSGFIPKEELRATLSRFVK